MSSPTESAESRLFQRNTMTAFIQIAALVILVGYSLQIVGPFASIVIWGVIMAVAVYPVHLRLTRSLNGSAKLSVGIITVTGLALLVLPAWIMTTSAIDSLAELAANLRGGTLSIPPPSDAVAGWPIVGEKLHAAWSSAASDMPGALAEYQPQVRELSEWLGRRIGALALGALQFAVSIVIAGVAMLYASGGYQLTCSIANRINPDRGKHWADLSVATIRSVTNGILGVAAIQAVLAGIGFFVMGVPHGGILAAIVLVTAIIQVPALLIMLPIAAWVFSFAGTVPATIFAIYAVIVSLSDNFLKPMLLGRGVDLPALIVLIGAIGGMIRFGVIGLFVGAVILGLGYTIIGDWIRHPGEKFVEEDAGKSE